MPLVLGVDSSTIATTVEVRDADTGTLVASGRRAHPGVTEHAEGDPTQWWSAFLDAVASTGQRDIAAMSVAAQNATVVTDLAGAVLRRAMLSTDRRASLHAHGLVEQFGAERWAKTVGLVPTSDTAVARIAWLRSADPDVFRRIGHVLLAHDWLTFRLTGRMVTDRGDASSTGYWSPRENRWRTDLLHRLDAGTSEEAWTQRLPAVLGPTTPADWMTASVHEIVGLRGRPIVAAGTGRPMAAALSIGLEHDEMAVSLGASGGVMAVADSPVADGSGRVRAYADASGRFLPTVPLPFAMAGLAGIASILGVDHDGLGRLARDAPPTSGGVTAVPSTPSRGAVVAGVGPDATPALLARAAFEGLACTVADAAERVVSATRRRSHGPLYVVGATGRSPMFRQILADVANVSVVATTDQSPVAKGACVQAAAALAGVSPQHIIAAWGHGAREVAEPSGNADTDAIRSAYSRLRGQGRQ